MRLITKNDIVFHETKRGQEWMWMWEGKVDLNRLILPPYYLRS
jgi:hypothetical protein